MPNRFTRIAAPDPAAVTVRLRASEAGPRGAVAGPAATGYRAGDDGGLSADEALAIGCALANRYGLTVVVMDDDGVWPSRWGILEPAAG